MTAYAVGYAALAILMIFPEPLLILDSLFVRLVGRSIVRVSQGAVDEQTAVRRIRRVEGLTPVQSARLFSSIASVVVALIAAVSGLSGGQMLLAVLLALGAAVLGMTSEKAALYKIGAAVAAALCFVILL